ncbi:MAG: 2-oxoglutarate dehydrogenase E1 component [Verrucomicrobia bacterium]|nr:2-oxoglutarate dehydrogenase E1 component [Verrucomicrobiota bacterium]
MSQNQPTYANLANLKLLEDLYAKWQNNPQSVDPSWQNFFDGMQLGSSLAKAFPPRLESADLRVYYLIQAYRSYGHLMARCNVTATDIPTLPNELKLENFGLTDKDLGSEFPTNELFEKEKAPLSEIIDVLQKTYCQTIGIEYMNLGNVAIEKWIQQQIEPYFPNHLSTTDKIEILKQLNQAEGFETFLHTKYVGQKRFSLEGEESFIPLLHAILGKGGELGVTDAVIGMAHRGRLNVLANIMGKSYGYIFEEFEDHYTPDLSESTGDVKYHMGFAGTYKKIQVILAANPSHLESVDPVVEGQVRALQEQKRSKQDQKQVLPILVHGDAAVAGQGVVYETLTLANLNGYGTKGTVHIVINNQIGFTTLPKDSRSTRYCTDIAKAFGAPVFHVSAEDPEACVAVANLALQLRQEFGCDVFIDLMGYRKYGHNETDEPSFTQPLQNQLIRAKKSIREIYRDRLIEGGILSGAQAEQIEKQFHDDLTKILETVKAAKPSAEKMKMRRKGKDLNQLFKPFETKVEKSTLLEIGKKIAQIPQGINIHPKIQRLLKERDNMLEQTVDWGMGELLAYGSLVTNGIHIRLTGQDTRRGTFSHRHALYVDQLTSAHYFPLSHLSESQASCDIYNSPLSEVGALGFEFGYSLMYPKSLVLWEGQFGDFVNGAQVIIDQYIAPSEMKWGQSTNLTLLLPHGYEGQGPEHSSARIERYLQLCADENMTVANCTTPAQFFHLLRRQALRPMKKPLIVFTPKVLLRHPLCRSPLKDFYEGHFEEILDDPNPPKNPKRVLICSGKIYYDLVQEREKRNADDVILRIEQLYPLQTEKLSALIKKYGSLPCCYVQEEHENMGAWNFVKNRIDNLSYIGRAEAASPAAGSHALHRLEQEILIQQLYSQGSPS